jgi:hypothetical protein
VHLNEEHLPLPNLEKQPIPEIVISTIENLKSDEKQLQSPTETKKDDQASSRRFSFFEEKTINSGDSMMNQSGLLVKDKSGTNNNDKKL